MIRKIWGTAALLALAGPICTFTPANAAPAAPAHQGSGKGYERLQDLTSKAQTALDAGHYAEAQRFARMLLKENTDKTSWNFGNVVYNGNQIIGLSALKSGDLEGAKRSLLAAGSTPGSPQLDSFGPKMALAEALYDRGERTVIVQFLGGVGKFWGREDAAIDPNPQFAAMKARQAATLKYWKRQLAAGKKPSFNCMDLGTPLTSAGVVRKR